MLTTLRIVIHMDKVNWWVAAPRDDQGKLDEGECACCGVSGCTMYNAPYRDDFGAIANPNEVSSGNLPETLRLRNAENTGYISLSVNGTSYGDTTNGVIYEAGGSSHIWAVYRNGTRTTRSSLFTESDYQSNTGVIKDDFPNQLFSEPRLDLYGYNGILNRVGVCAWASDALYADYGFPAFFVAYYYSPETCGIDGPYAIGPLGPSWWGGSYSGSVTAKLGGGGLMTGTHHGDFPIGICYGDENYIKWEVYE